MMLASAITAIITAAGLINACYLTDREFKDIRVVVNGAGAAAIPPGAMEGYCFSGTVIGLPHE